MCHWVCLGPGTDMCTAHLGLAAKLRGTWDISGGIQGYMGYGDGMIPLVSVVLVVVGTTGCDSGLDWAID